MYNDLTTERKKERKKERYKNEYELFLSRATRPITHTVGRSVGTTLLLACKWAFLALPNRPQHRLPCIRPCFLNDPLNIEHLHIEHLHNIV